MVTVYEAKSIGKDHARFQLPMQDYSRWDTVPENDEWYIAAVADGVGSAANAEIGAQIAVNTAIDYCLNNFPTVIHEKTINSMLILAYDKALKAIKERANLEDNPIESYDTTLDIVIYNQETLFFGHVGDGGIIVLDDFGEAFPITREHHGPDGISVIPLRFGPKYWEFGRSYDVINGVVMVTDGMLKALTPFLLKFRDKENPNPVYIHSINYLLSRLEGGQERLQHLLEEKATPEEYIRALEYEYKKFFEPEQVKEILTSIIDNKYKGVGFFYQVRDDKTALVLLNPDAERKSLDYELYIDEDWDELTRNFNQLAYPGDTILQEEMIEEVEEIEETEKNENTLLNNGVIEDESVKQNNFENSLDQEDDVIPLEQNILEIPLEQETSEIILEEESDETTKELDLLVNVIANLENVETNEDNL